jgi:hypothetical protein
LERPGLRRCSPAATTQFPKSGRRAAAISDPPHPQAAALHEWHCRNLRDVRNTQAPIQHPLRKSYWHRLDVPEGIPRAPLSLGARAGTHSNDDSGFLVLAVHGFQRSAHRVVPASDLPRGGRSHGAAAIAYSTWFLWTIASAASAALYAACNVLDPLLAAINAMNALCCLAVILLTAYKRRVLKQTRMP